MPFISRLGSSPECPNQDFEVEKMDELTFQFRDFAPFSSATSQVSLVSDV
jgi:hypothetical protein